jgi:rhodanese-related sulfurtransferase
MRSNAIRESLSVAWREIRSRAQNTPAQSFRRSLALRLHMQRLLGPLTLEQVSSLVENARLRNFRAGDTVLESFEAARYHLLVLQGEVEVEHWQRGNSGRRQRHSRLRPLELLGGFSLLGATSRQLRATAVSAGRCLLIDADMADAIAGWNEQFNLMKLDDPAPWRGVSAMRNVRAFDRIPPGRVEAVVRRMAVRSVPPGTLLASEGDPVDGLMIIEAGQAEACYRDPETGHASHLVGLGAGDVIDRHMQERDGCQAVSIRMVTPGRLRVISTQELESLTQGADEAVVPASQARAMLETGQARMLDCRCGLEVLEPRIPGAIGIPLDRLRWDISQLDRGVHYLVYCRAGRLSSVAAHLLQRQGFRASPLAGGLNAWPYELEWG